MSVTGHSGASDGSDRRPQVVPYLSDEFAALALERRWSRASRPARGLTDPTTVRVSDGTIPHQLVSALLHVAEHGGDTPRARDLMYDGRLHERSVAAAAAGRAAPHLCAYGAWAMWVAEPVTSTGDGMPVLSPAGVPLPTAALRRGRSLGSLQLPDPDEPVFRDILAGALSASLVLTFLTGHVGAQGALLVDDRFMPGDPTQTAVISAVRGRTVIVRCGRPISLAWCGEPQTVALSLVLTDGDGRRRHLV